MSFSKIGTGSTHGAQDILRVQFLLAVKLSGWLDGCTDRRREGGKQEWMEGCMMDGRREGEGGGEERGRVEGRGGSNDES